MGKKSLKNVMILVFIISINIFIVLNTKQISALGGDFNAYGWGACLSGIAEALKYNELRLWNPNIWNGISGIHNFTAPFYPFLLFIGKIFWNAEKELLSFDAQLLYVLIHGIITTVGFYFLFKELKLSDIACFLMVVIGTPLAIKPLQWSWLPVFGFFMIKAYRKERIVNIFSIMAGVSFGLYLLQGLAQDAVLGMIIAGLFYITAICTTMCNKGEIKTVKRLSLLFAFAGLIGIGIGAVNLLPVLQQQKDLLRFLQGGVGELTKGVPLSALYEHPVSLSGLREMLGAESGKSWFGICAVIFMYVGIFTKGNYQQDKCKYVFLQFGKVLYVFMLLASISCYFPELIYHIPFINMVRETYLYASLLPIITTLLVTFGIDSLYNCIIKKREKDQLFFNVFLLRIVVLLIIIQYALANYKRSLIWILVFLGMYILLSFIFRKKAKIVYILLFFMGALNFWGIYCWNNSFYNYTYAEAKSQYEKVTDGYKRLQNFMDSNNEGNDVYRVMTWGGSAGSISPNSMVDIGGYYTEGYWEPIYKKTLHMHTDLALEKRFLLNNVLFFIISENESEEYMAWLNTYLDEYFELIGTVDNIYSHYDAMEGQTICIYKNKNYEGDAWFVYDYTTCDSNMSIEEQFSIINDPSFDLRNKALVEINSDDTLDSLNKVSHKDENASVVINNYTNNSVEIQCQTASNGILVMAESDACGWKVFVDGKKQKVITVDYGKRGVIVEPGIHTVKFIYLPNSFVVGLIITSITVWGCLIMVVIIVCSRKNKSKR